MFRLTSREYRSRMNRRYRADHESPELCAEQSRGGPRDGDGEWPPRGRLYPVI